MPSWRWVNGYSRIITPSGFIVQSNINTTVVSALMVHLLIISLFRVSLAATNLLELVYKMKIIFKP